MITVELITGRQLLKLIHVSDLEVQLFVELIAEPDKEPVLVENVIGDFFTGVEVYFIVENKKECFGVEKCMVQRYHQVKQVPETVVELIAILQFIRSDFPVEPLFEPDPLLGLEALLAARPQNLLPEPVFGPDGMQPGGGKTARVGVADRQPYVVFDEVRYPGPDELGRPAIEEIGPSGMYIQPEAPFVRQPGLIEIPQPCLALVVYLFLGGRKTGNKA